jgi:outer membrane lipoprotein carrier protein
MTMRFLMAGLMLLFASQASAHKIDDFLSNLRTFQADFEQVVESDSGRTLPVHGVFYLKRPGLFRWDYEGEGAQLIVADGKRVWLLDRELDQVSHQSQKSALRGTPAQLLSGQGGVEKYFSIHRDYEANGLQWTQLIPKDADSQMEQVSIAFEGKQLKRLEMTDKFNQTTRFSFTNTQRNPRLDASLFKFEAPPGFDVWEH